MPRSLFPTTTVRSQGASLAGRISIWLAFLMLVCGSAAAHPKPGAHADVRIAIEQDEVRLDCLMNILFVDQLVRTRRAAVDRVDDGEAKALAAALAEYFGATKAGPVTAVLDRPNRVVIDGLEVAPVIRGFEIVRPEQESRPGFVPNPALLLPQVHVKAIYPCKSLPKSVRLQWGSFPRDFTRLEGDTAPVSDVEATLSAPGAFDVIRFTKSEPEFIWHGAKVASPFVQIAPAKTRGEAHPHARTALMVGAGVVAASGAMLVFRPRRRRLGAIAIGASAMVAGAGLIGPSADEGAAVLPDDAAAAAIFKALHENIYRAFDYTREGEIFDALARSVDGPLLGAVYESIYRDLIMQEEGGAVSRVRSVQVSEASVKRPATGGELIISARWTVEGVVYHWGHSHRRLNEYEGDYSISPRHGEWKITGATMKAQRRLESDSQRTSPASRPDPAPESTPWKPDR